MNGPRAGDHGPLKGIGQPACSMPSGRPRRCSPGTRRRSTLRATYWFRSSNAMSSPVAASTTPSQVPTSPSMVGADDPGQAEVVAVAASPSGRTRGGAPRAVLDHEGLRVLRDRRPRLVGADAGRAPGSMRRPSSRRPSSTRFPWFRTAVSPASRTGIPSSAPRRRRPGRAPRRSWTAMRGDAQLGLVDAQDGGVAREVFADRASRRPPPMRGRRPHGRRRPATAGVAHAGAGDQRHGSGSATPGVPRGAS